MKNTTIYLNDHEKESALKHVAWLEDKTSEPFNKLLVRNSDLKEGEGEIIVDVDVRGFKWLNETELVYTF